MLPNESALVKALWPMLKDDVNTSERLHDAIVAAFFPLPNLTKSVKEIALDSTMALLSKACKTHRAVTIVATNGLGQDANTLTRSLYETMLQVLFIFLDEENEHLRTSTLHARTVKHGLKILAKWNDERKEMVTPLREALQEQLTNLTGRFTDVASAEAHWAGLGSVESLARMIGQNESYQVVYRILSMNVHGHDLAAHITTAPNGERPPTLNLCPSLDETHTALALARTCLWNMAHRMNDRLGLGLDERIRAVQPPDDDLERFNKVAQ